MLAQSAASFPVGLAGLDPEDILAFSLGVVFYDGLASSRSTTFCGFIWGWLYSHCMVWRPALASETDRRRDAVLRPTFLEVQGAP